MAQEIQSQIDAIEKHEHNTVGVDKSRTKRASILRSRRNSTFSSKYTDDGMEALDAEIVNDDVRECFRDAIHTSSRWGRIDPDYNGRSGHFSMMPDDVTTEDFMELQDRLKKTEHDLEHAERKAKDQSREYDEKLEIERKHYCNTREALIKSHREEVTRLSQEIDHVKKDAKTVIDFVRRRANEAIDGEKEKRRNEKRKMQKEIQEMDVHLREKVSNRLHSVENQIKYALRQEQAAIDSMNGISMSHSVDKSQSDTESYNQRHKLPSPPRPALRKQKSSKRHVHIQNESVKPQLYVHVPNPHPSDESIQSSLPSDDDEILRRSKRFDFNKEKSYVSRRNSTVSNAHMRLHPSPPVPSPPPVRRMSMARRWEL